MAERRGIRARTAEIALAALFIAAGAIAAADAWRIGIAWDLDGPQSGTFPFWTAVVMIAAGLVVLAHAAASPSRARFASAAELAAGARLILPAAAFVAGLSVLGLYLAAALLIAWFLVALGGWRPTIGLAAEAAAAAGLFVVFERWLLVALPKGPVEALVGL